MINMARSKEGAIRDNWKVGQIRATFFGKVDTALETKSYWPTIKDASIDKETHNPKTGQRVIEGSINNQKLSVIILPIRIDLFLNPPDPLNVDKDDISIPDLGSMEKVFKEFHSLIKEWLSNESFSKIEFNRVALGADLLIKSRSAEEAYDKLSEFLPFKVSAKDSSDFIYQINKFVKSDTFKDLKMNRITRWDVLKLNAEIASQGYPKIKHEYPDVRYCHLTLDLSSAVSEKNFNNKLAESLFIELNSFAFGIASKGIK